MLIIFVSVMLIAGITVQSHAGGFDDVPLDHWAYTAVQYLYDKGVLEGDEWGKFNGDDAMTRYEFAVAIARIVDILEDYATAGGYDVEGEMQELTDDIYAIVEELEDEFSAEIDSIRATLAVHGSKINTLEEDVQETKGAIEGIADKVKKLNISFKGDALLRFEGKYASDDSQVQRPRVRFRLGLEAPVNDEVKFKGRLASGSSAGPTSTIQTFEDEFEKRPLWIDRVYLEWAPSNLEGWKFLAGKFGPNWRNTLITIDSDVNVEGIAQSYRSDDGFVLNLAELVPDDKGFYIVGQVGKEGLFTDGLDFYAGFHYINDGAWQFIEQKLKDGDLKNNMRLDRIDMDNYSALDIIGSYSWDMGGTPLSITGNYVRNLADAADIEDGCAMEEGAYAQLKVGKAKEIGDVEGWIEYGKLQANSVLSFLTDAARGSGDHKFWGSGLKYVWMKNFNIALKFIYADRLTKDENYKLVQVDFLSEF
jgi:hypothetical protein